MKEYNASKKVDGKWFTFGRIKKNQYGNYQLSFKNTDALKKLVNAGDEWINFSLFEQKDKEEAPKETVATGAIPPDDEIPFAWLIGLGLTGMSLLQNGWV